MTVNGHRALCLCLSEQLYQPDVSSQADVALVVAPTPDGRGRCAAWATRRLPAARTRTAGPARRERTEKRLLPQAATDGKARETGIAGGGARSGLQCLGWT